ncbi:MAG: hypothetical protein HYZ28_05675 [Myxococcales bacterium]|nr:hypothetical protein [Myxococcales bacterium]
MKLAPLAAALCVLVATPSFAASVAKREVRQQQRIARGVRSGQLTRAEAVSLERQEARLHRQIQRDRVDGGRFTLSERAKAQARQDRMSAKIYRQKHDGQVRK